MSETISDVATDKFEPISSGSSECVEILLFQCGFIKGVQIVEHAYSMILPQQTFANMRANEAGPASNEKIHWRGRGISAC